MNVPRVARRFLSSWLAFVLVVSPVLTFFLDLVLRTSRGIEWSAQIVLALVLAVAFLRHEYSLNSLWSYVRILWTGFLLYVVAFLVVVVGVSLAFGVTPVRPSELGPKYQFAAGLLGGFVYLHLYRSAYRKTSSERSTTS